MRDLDINEVITGMILIDNNENKFVVIETNLNGDDEYLSKLRIISEDEYLQYQGKAVNEERIETAKWIEEFEYRREYRVCEKQYAKVNTEKIFWF